MQIIILSEIGLKVIFEKNKNTTMKMQLYVLCFVRNVITLEKKDLKKHVSHSFDDTI